MDVLSRQPVLVVFCGVESRGVVLVGAEGEEDAFECLHVGDVAAAADYGGWGVVGEGEETVDVGEAGERAVGCLG